MGHTIVEQVNELIKANKGTPTGNGGSIVDKLDQLIIDRGGEGPHPAETIQDKLKKIAELNAR